MQEPVALTIQHSITANHADTPGTLTGPAGIPIPVWAVKLEFQAQLRSKTGTPTVPCAVYARDRYNHSTWYSLASTANVRLETAERYTYTITNPEHYDMIAAYVTGASGTFSLDCDCVAAASSGGGSSSGSVVTDTSATPGAAHASKVTQIGGSDGTNARYVATDTSGNLKVLQTNTEATPGSAIPSKASQVSGSDGTNARVISTDTSGKLNVVQPNTDATIGSAVLTKATQVAGSDGTNARTIATTTAGIVKTTNTNVEATIASAVLGYANQVSGSDGTNARLLATDTSGHVKTKPPTPGSAETIAYTTLADPIAVNCLAIAADSVAVAVQGKIVAANSATAIKITLFGRTLMNAEIATIAGAVFENMGVNGSFSCFIAPEPVGMSYDLLGARLDYTDGGGGAPTMQVKLVQRK